MALADNNVFSVTRRKPPIRMTAEHAEPVPFAEAALVGGLKVFLETGVPVTRGAGNNWVVWTNGAAINGFLYFQGGGTKKKRIDTTATPDTLLEGIELEDTGGGEVHGVVMTHGQIHVDDVVLPAGEVQGNLDTALQALLGSNLHIQGSE